MYYVVVVKTWQGNAVATYGPFLSYSAASRWADKEHTLWEVHTLEFPRGVQ